MSSCHPADLVAELLVKKKYRRLTVPEETPPFFWNQPPAAIVGMVWSSKSRNIGNGHRQLSDHGHINPYVVGLIFRLIFPSTLGDLQLGREHRHTIPYHTPPLFFLLLLTSVARTISTKYSTSVKAPWEDGWFVNLIEEKDIITVDILVMNYVTCHVIHSDTQSSQAVLLKSVELLQISESLRVKKCDTRLKN